MLRNALSFLLLCGMIAAPAAASAKLRVVCTVPDLAALARDIGGADVEVQALVPPNQDPHYVDARPSLVLPIARADLLIVNGLELEVGWLPPLLRSSRNASVQRGQAGYLDAGLLVDRKQVAGAAATRAQGDIHAAGNPHYTHAPGAAAVVARGIGERMAQLDPSHAAAYRSRAATLGRQLDALANEARARFAKLPLQRRQVVSYHPSLIYLFDGLGLSQVATIEPLPGIPPNPSHVAKVLETLRATGAPAIVQEPYYPRSVSQTLAKLAKVTLVVVPGGANFAQGETYIARARRTIEALHGALAR